jgi:hypothetical protein
MKKFILIAAFILPVVSSAASAGQMVKARLWYEGIERQPKNEVSNVKIDNAQPTKTVSSTEFVEELSRPMHLVLKKHQIILKQ